MTTQTNQFRV